MVHVTIELNRTLREQYLALYNRVCLKNYTIVLVMATSPPNETFRQDLIGPKLVAWNALLQCLESIQLSTGPGEFCWNLHPNGKLSVGS
jgi:hypothetical protein